jgi:hypothetical protein
MSNLYREYSIHSFYQISVHLGNRIQRRRFFRNQPIRKNNGLWRTTLPNEPELGRTHLWNVVYKVAHLVLIRKQTWLPQAILVSDWSISKNLP